MGRFVSKTIRRLSSLMAFFSLKHRGGRARWAFVCTAVFGIFLIVTPAHAQLESVANAFLWAFSQIMLMLARLFIALSVFALKFFIEIAQYNNYVDTPTVVLGWTMVRDVANMFFVVILLVIAFATILGVEQYEWKKTLVKLVFAAVFINFSKLITGIIIDFAHVFTITFLNAVSATAGGNLINMFHLNDIYRITGTEFGDDGVQIEVFGGAFMAFLFAGMTLITIGTYLVVMIARMVVLWVLIILSPIAFIMQVLPNTQQWAKEWWNRFSKQVLVAPVMVFFLWLAFATLGTGNFLGDLEINVDTSEATTALNQGQGTTSSGGSGQKVSISDVSSWENMANFFIAVAFLFVGIGVVQKLGVVGGGVVSGLTGFGKRVATIATGYAAGRWLVGRGAQAGKESLGDYGKLLQARTVGELRHAPVVREIPLIGKAGSARRKAAVKKATELEETRLAQYKSEGGGLAGRLAPSKDTRAKATIDAENAKRRSEAQYGFVEGQMRVNMIIGQKKEMKKRLEEARKEVLDAKPEGEGLSPQESADLYKKVANEMKEKGMDLPALALEEATAGAKKAKAEKETDIVGRMAKDVDRMTENKLAKYIRQFEDAEFNDDVKSFAIMDFDTRLEEIQSQMKVVKDLRNEYGADLTGAEELPEAEKKRVKDAYKNGMRNIQLLLTSAYEQGEGNDIMEYGVIPSLDIPDEIKDNWNDKDNIGKFVQMAITQGSVYNANGEFDVEAARSEEENVRKVVGDKWNLTMRGLMRAMNTHAVKDGNPTAFNQIRAGVNQSGVETLSFADNMEAGTVKSSDKEVIASGQAISGEELRRLKQDFLSGEIQKITQIKDARAIINMDREGSAAKPADETVKKMLSSIARLTANDIRSNLHRSVLNMMSGGKYDKSSINDAGTAFAPISEQMETVFRGVIDDMKAGLQEAVASGNRQTYDRRFEALQELMFQLTKKRMGRGAIENLRIGDNAIGEIPQIQQNQNQEQGQDQGDQEQ